MQATKKVLVIDDDPVVGKSFRRVLAAKGYAVMSVASGAEALERLKHEDYDVVYADIKMPGMSGLEVTERIKANRPWLPVVIVTGYGSDANEARALELGVAAFLRKPLSPEMIEGSALKALRDVAVPVAPRLEAAEALAVPPAAAPGTSEGAGESGTAALLKALGLMVAAPFIGLAYAIAFPFIGLAVLAYMAAREVWKRSGTIGRAVKDIALFFAAPFVGLAYVIAFPFVGLGMLVWMALRALKKPAAE
jgi:CheY-like chemotaxis protein